MAIEYFPRRPVSRPSTRIQTDSSALTGVATDSKKPIMIIGSAEGGRPNTVYRLRNIIQAKKIFRGGELLDALEMVWNPSNVSPGGGIVLAMRVEEGKQAKLEQEGITFKSKLFGNEANGIEVSLGEENSNLSDAHVLEVKFDKDDYRRTYRNIGDIFRFTKEEDGPEYVSVEVTKEKLIVYTGKSAEEKSKKEYTLGTGSSRQANILANSLNSIAGINVTIPTGGNKNINTKGLDSMEEKEIVVGEEVIVTALLADIYNQLQYDEYVEVEIPDKYINKELTTDTELVINGGADIKDFSEEALTGGETGEVPRTWADKFNLLANKGGYYLVPLTDNPAVHAEASAFVNGRTDNGEPMRTIVGAGYNETPSQLLGRAGAIRNPRTMLIGFSGRTNLSDGRVIKIPAYMYAAQIAGIASGLSIGESITFEEIRLTDLAEIYDTDQMDTLNLGGVVMAEFVRNRENTYFRVVDDVTTYNDQSDPVRNQMGVGEGSDFLVSELKIMLDENYIGSSVINLSASLIKSSIRSFLDQKKRENEIQDYNPEDIQVVIDGEVANISMVVYPIRSLKRIEVSLVYKQQILES